MKYFTSLLLIAAGFVLTSCGTVAGFGQDLGRAGSNIEEAATR